MIAEGLAKLGDRLDRENKENRDVDDLNDCKVRGDH